MFKDLQDDEVEHTSSLQRWEVASESNALPCQASYFRLRSLFFDLLTAFPSCSEGRLKIAVKHSPAGKPALKEGFPGDIKLQLQPRKLAHQAMSEVENPVLGDSRPPRALLISGWW